MSGTKGWASEEAIDWDKVSEDPPAPLEDGGYMAVIAKAEAKQTKDDKPALGIELHVTQPYGGEPGSLNRKVFDTVTFTAEAAFRAKQLATATGVTPPRSTGFDAINDFAQALVGCTVWIKTRRNTFQGKTNAKVDVYVPEAKLEQVMAGAPAVAGSEAASPAARAKRGRPAPASA